MSTTTETEFFGEDPTAVTTPPDLESGPKQGKDTKGEDDNPEMDPICMPPSCGD